MTTVNVTYDYVYFSGGGSHTRRPRSGSGPGGFTLLKSQPGGNQTTGLKYQASSQPGTWTVGGTLPGSAEQNYIFAFMTVTGGIPEGQSVPAGVTSFDNNEPPPKVTVDSDIVVLVVYVPTGVVGPGGGSGAVIDSFNETIGQLFDDDFVTVAPDPGGPPPPLANSGNLDGFVKTTNTETISALSPTSPSRDVFDQWQLLYPKATVRVVPGDPVPKTITVYPPGINVSGNALEVTAGTSVYALAFYKSPVPTTCQEILANWNAVPNKAENESVLAYYREKLSACSGPQYAAAVAEITALLKEYFGT
jgi:hypothetical protein